MNYFKLIFLLLILVKLKKCSHFRGGTMFASPVEYNSTSVVMSITTHFAWRLSFSSATYCDATTISSGALFGIINNIVCKLNCFTASEVIGTTVMYCTAFSPSTLDDWSYGTYKFNHTFPLSNDIEFSFSGTSWANLVVGGSSSSWEIRLTINTLNRTDTGRVNSAPKTLIAPLIVVRQGIEYGINIPYVDPDVTDTVRCRWSESAKGECGGICQAVPMGVLDSNNCLLYINATTATPGLYAASIQIEDFATANSTTALSSVPIQFLVWVKSINSNCTTNPVIIGDLPLDACIIANNPMTTKIVANVSCASVSITDIQMISGVSLTISNLINLNNVTWYKNMTWNPPIASGVNSYLICSTATDSALLSSPSSCFTFITGIQEPQVNMSSLSPNNIVLTKAATTDTQLFSCTFNLNNMIKPPSTQTTTPYIRIYSKQTNLEVMSLNTILSNTTQFTATQVMQFSIPFGLLPVGDYYILFDWGVAVYNDYCLPLSEPITDSSAWTFSILSNILSNSAVTTTTPLTNANQNLPFCSNVGFCVGMILLGSLLGCCLCLLPLLFLLRKCLKHSISDKYKAVLVDETDPSLDTYCIMTIHDLGCDHTYFNNFRLFPHISIIKNRFKWLHISLPGQEKSAQSLNITKYPCLIEIADELARILDHYRIDKVICLGDGAGADICTTFSIINPKRCLGLCLIRPNGSIASLNERLLYLTNNINPYDIKMTKTEANLFAYIVWHRFGFNLNEKIDSKAQEIINEFSICNFQFRNMSNLYMYWNSFLNRTNITKNLNEVRVPVLISYSKKASFIHKSRKFYRKLYDSRKLSNSPDIYVFEYDDYNDPFVELSKEFSSFFKSFLNEITNKIEEEKLDRKRKHSKEFKHIV